MLNLYPAFKFEKFFNGILLMEQDTYNPFFTSGRKLILM
jgi:hypothetical protein